MKGIRIYLIAIAFIIALLLRSDYIQFLKWWLALFGLGIVFIPLTGVIFKQFAAKGYIFSKIIGIAVSGYLVWMAASLKLLPFRAWMVYLILACCLTANIAISRKTKAFEDIIKDRDLLRRIVFQEAVFIFTLFYWSYLRGLKPAIYNTLEMYMDFGFMNSILRSDYFPPLDMWFAGEPINYYYLGQYFAAYLTRVSFVPPQISYNLMIAALFAISFMASFTIGEQLFEIYEQNSTGFYPLKYAKPFCGLLAGALVTLSGNLHTPIFALFAKGKNQYGYYWFPDATRYIGHNPPTGNDETIHEFPHYSYIVSDLHAHVLNMIFVLAVIGIAVAVSMNMLARPEDGPKDKLFDAKRYLPGFCMIIFLIGLFPAANFWDFPIYIVVSGVMYLYANLRLYDYKIKAWLITAGQVVLTAAAAWIVVLPFHLNFDTISTEVLFVTTNSKFYQLLVLYGYQASFFAILIVSAVVAYNKFGITPKKTRENKKAAVSSSDMPLKVPPNITEQPKLYDFIEKSNPADILAILLFTCAIGLIAIPEIIYVKDIYPNHPRANTMFKLCYQAFIMLALGVGYTFCRTFLYRGKKGNYTIYALALSIVLLAGAFMYPFYSIQGWYGSMHFSNYQGLDGLKYMLTHQEQLTRLEEESFPEGEEPEGDPESWPWVLSLVDDYPIVQYINENIKGQPVIAEASHLSYTTFGRVTANTGLPGIFNWRTHQLLWRNKDEMKFDERIWDLEDLYTTDDANLARYIIDKYNIRYIMVGKLERAKYRNRINEDMLRSLGSIAIQVNDTYLIEVQGTSYKVQD